MSHPYLSCCDTIPISMMRFLIPLCMLVLVSACEIAGPDSPEPMTEREERLEAWNDFQDGTYAFVLTRGCFCWPSGDFDVQVVNGEITSAYSRFEGVYLPAEQIEWLETIDRMFELIEQAEREADMLEVEYSDDGFPTSISIDWIREAVDDEMFLLVQNVRPGVHDLDQTQ